MIMFFCSMILPEESQAGSPQDHDKNQALITNLGFFQAHRAAERPLYLMMPRDALDDNPNVFRYKNGQVRFDFDILKLSSLQQHPAEVLDFVGPKSKTFRLYFQSHYGQSACLTAAVDCIALHFQHLLLPERRNLDTLAIQSYVKALSSLRTALNEPGVQNEMFLVR